MAHLLRVSGRAALSFSRGGGRCAAAGAVEAVSSRPCYRCFSNDVFHDKERAEESIWIANQEKEALEEERLRAIRDEKLAKAKADKAETEAKAAQGARDAVAGGADTAGKDAKK
jgi:hypothetical protein